mmetsp:Transcript_3551/g.6880  ORF Transcript_3551/g.6880 Transcript_3551/m.6880 type:complete len:436 (-) Transcript_3551:46-1353(-)
MACEDGAVEAAPGDCCTDAHGNCAVSEGASRLRLETELFSMQDPDDECEEPEGGSMTSAEQAAAEFALGEAPPRLSYMFEHNDLINNRIAALASAIRTGVLPRAVRWSVPAAEVTSIGGTRSSSSSSASSCASPCQGTKHLVHAGWGESGQATGVEGHGAEPEVVENQKNLEGRCRVLEHMLQEAQRENASLREQLARASVSSVGTATRKSVEACKLHRPAGERKVSLSAPELDPPPVRTAGPLQEKVSAPDAPPLGAARRSTQRRQTRRRLVLEQARCRRSEVAAAGLQRLAVRPDEKLEECETIITRLVDEIEVLTSGKVPAAKTETTVPEQDIAPMASERNRGSSHSVVKDELQSPRPSAFFAVEDLKNAISDFFGGFGTAEDKPVESSKKLQTAQRMQMAAKQMQANKPRRTRVREEGSRSVRRSESHPFI